MADRVAPRFPPLDLRKKKGKVSPHTKPMPHPSPKDNIALPPIPYNWSRYFIRDATMKIVTLKPNVEFDQNDGMLFYFKDMCENSRLASTSEYDKEDTSNHMCMVQIFCPTKIYRFNDWQMCFSRQEKDNDFYQCIIHDIPPICTPFIFNLHQHPKVAMWRAIVTAWAHHPKLKEHLLSLD